MRASWPGYATIALDRCPLEPGDGSLRHSYRPSSEGTFRVDTPGNNPIYAVDRGSVIEADTPAARLQALARYLDVDWAWIQRRCRSLARAGTAGLLRPRSRLISTVGVDTACSYLGQSEVAHV